MWLRHVHNKGEVNQKKHKEDSRMVEHGAIET